MRTNQIRVFHYSTGVLGNFHAWRGWNRDGWAKFPSRPAFATFTRDPGSRFSMHVTRNLCDRQRETGNPKWRKFPSNLSKPYRTSSGSQIQLVILDERELVSPACQRLLRRASIGSISANSLSLSLSRKHVLFVFNLKKSREDGSWRRRSRGSFNNRWLALDGNVEETRIIINEM